MTVTHRNEDVPSLLAALTTAAVVHASDRAFVHALRHVFGDRAVEVTFADGRVERDGTRFETSVRAIGLHGDAGMLRIGEPRPAWAADPASCDAIARTLGAALVARTRLMRVAGASREANRARRALDERVRDLEGEGTFVAASPAMREVARRIDIVAPVPTTVLLLGETGTGKELAARRIHALGRAGEPFVAVNCGAIPEGLVESELFGHEVGAFTGATRRRRGRFELAARGTIFLDEIGELPLASQVRLLRVLQEREIEPVGAERTLPIDCRVIVATHRDLPRMVADGTFRADLYYRIATYPVVIPPLRDRPLDVPILVRTKLAMLAKRLGRDVPEVPSRLLAALCTRDFPGNVRELENVLERALLMSTDTLVLEEENAMFHAPPRTTRAPSFDEATRAILIDALEATRGKLYGEDGAAARLGLHPSTLQTKLLKYAIERTDFTPR